MPINIFFIRLRRYKHRYPGRLGRYHLPYPVTEATTAAVVYARVNVHARFITVIIIIVIIITIVVIAGRVRYWNATFITRTRSVVVITILLLLLRFIFSIILLST